MSRSGVSRLLHRRDQLIQLVGRSLGDWWVALNLLRLRMADKLIARHPQTARTILTPSEHFLVTSSRPHTCGRREARR